VDEPEPYEAPPVASRFRASGTEVQPGPPQSFELPLHPRADAALAEAATGSDDPLPPGGPTFVRSSIIEAPVGPPGQRKPDPTSSAPLPGTFKKDWSTPVPKRSRRTGRHVAPMLVLVVLAAAAYVAAPRVRVWFADRSVPGDLRAYVDGRGVSYAPAGEGYVVRLPARPIAGDVVVAATAAEPALVMHQSVLLRADFKIVIGVADLSGGHALRNGLLGVVQDVPLVGNAPTHVREVVFAGRSAIDYDLNASPTIHASVVLGGEHLYVISVQAKSAGTVLDALTTSLRLSP
jgi:hypothetical protein